jgi:uncharacterized membrane protein
MNGEVVSNLIAIIVSAMMTYGLGSYLVLSRRFPGKDPRITSSRFTFSQKLFPLLGFIGIFAALFVGANALGLAEVYRYFGYTLVGFWSVVNYYLNKRYGRLGANEEPPKIGSMKLTTLLVGLCILLVIFTLLGGFLNFPKFYSQLAWIAFMVIFIVSIVWVRRSRKKNHL